MFFSVALLGLVSTNCTRSSKEIASVGSYKLNSRELEMAREVRRLLNRNDEESKVADEICLAFSSAEILVRFGIPLTPQEIKDEAKRIEKESVQPELLNQVKKILGDGTSEYLKLFVLPTLAQRRLQRDFFRFSPQTQGEIGKLADTLSKKAKSNKKPFSSWPSREGVTVSAFYLGPLGEVTDQESDISLPAGIKEKTALDSETTGKLQRLGEGASLPEALESGDQFLIFRRIYNFKKFRGWKKFEVLTVSKRKWEPWLANQSSTLMRSGLCAP